MFRFLLAKLHIDTLALEEPTAGHIKRALQNLPPGLDEIYGQAMIRIQSQGGGSRELAMKILSWIVHARRVLSTAELQHAVAVEPGKFKLNQDLIPNLDIIGSICAGLIAMDLESHAVRLVHYTAQEYFDRRQGYWFPDAETHIATTCITYLSFNVFNNGLCETSGRFQDRLRLYPLYDYAARN